jgi:divalent metal cation (Fe/Co/Zn/Cd) transporter
MSSAPAPARGYPSSMDRRQRHDDVRSAIVVSVATVAWDTVLGAVAIATAVATGTVALAAFGLDAAVDAFASVMLIRRFSTERRNPGEGNRLELSTVTAVGALLVVFGLLIVAGALRSLVTRDGPDVSTFALAQAVASVIALPALALWKRRLAARLGSRALRADSILTAAGAALAAVALLGLSLDRAFGWWWADPAAALAIAALLFLEGARGLAGRASGRTAP